MNRLLMMAASVMTLLFQNQLAQAKNVWEETHSFASGQIRVLEYIQEPSRQPLFLAGTDKGVWTCPEHDACSQFLPELSGRPVHSLTLAKSFLYILSDHQFLIVSWPDASVLHREIFKSPLPESRPIGRDISTYTTFSKGSLRIWDPLEWRWNKIALPSVQNSVRTIFYSENYVFLLTDRRVWRYDPGATSLDLIYESLSDDGIEEESENADTEESSSLRLDVLSEKNLYILDQFRVYRSDDSGEEWTLAGQLPRAAAPARDFAVSVPAQGEHQEIFWIITPSGCWSGRAGQIRKNNQGLMETDLRRIWRGPDQQMWTHTAKRIYRFNTEIRLDGDGRSDPISPPMFSDKELEACYERLTRQRACEPAVQDLHQIALDYADLRPEKIQEWFRLARTQAWAPQLTVRVDEGFDKSRSDRIWGSYTGGGQHYMGPDATSSGQDWGWSASLSWDFADLLFNSNMTSIEVRAKALADLREDILNELTRLYYERRRYQDQLCGEKAASAVDRRRILMQIDEMTALMDIYLGGAMSEWIHSRQCLLIPDNTAVIKTP